MSKKLGLILLFVLAGTVAVPAWRIQNQPSYDAVRFAENVMVPMRDGTKLATDIYRPTRNGSLTDEKLPLLLQRTPYNKEGAGLVDRAKYFARRGYVVAVQDIRG